MPLIIMKKTLVLIALFCFINKQSYSQTTNNADSIIVKGSNVEVEPQFDKGVSSWAKFLKKHLDYDTPRFNEAPSGIYKVIIKFTIFADGHLGNFTRLTRFGYGMEDEVIRVLKKSPKWKPYVKNNLPIDSEKTQTVTFTVSY